MSMQTTLLPTDLRQEALERLEMGRLVITGKSLKSGKHITLRFKCKGPKGSRKRNVFLKDATLVACDAGRVQRRHEIGADGEEFEYVGGDRVGFTFGDKLIHALNTNTRIELRPNYDSDPARLWLANYILAWLAGHSTMNPDLELNLEDFCAHCGRELTHPESKARGLGPVCYGKKTEGQHQTKGQS